MSGYQLEVHVLFFFIFLQTKIYAILYGYL
jgi:hypothetical protein